MAITIAGAAAASVLGMKFTSTTGDSALKRTLLGGAVADADIEQHVQDMDDLSNAKITKAKYAGRVISGMDTAAATTSQNLVSAFMQLDFTQVDPIDAENTITRTWRLPAYLDTLRGTDNLPEFTTPGSGSAAAKLARIIDFLETNLAFQAADGSFVVGGFTYNGGGFGTGADVLDGV